MRKIEVSLYKFDELTPKAKQKAIDDLRNSGDYPHDKWYEYVYDDCLEIFTMLGFRTSQKQMAHNGFGNQGDGACFEGEWFPENIDIDRLKAYAPQDLKLHGIAVAFVYLAERMPHAIATLDHYGRYYHENSITFMIDGNRNEEPFATVDDLVAEQFRNACKALFRWFYERLENDYGYYTSDEGITENLQNNDYEYTENGNFHS
jgi:hypothetical protein